MVDVNAADVDVLDCSRTFGAGSVARLDATRDRPRDHVRHNEAENEKERRGASAIGDVLLIPTSHTVTLGRRRSRAGERHQPHESGILAVDADFRQLPPGRRGTLAWTICHSR